MNLWPNPLNLHRASKIDCPECNGRGWFAVPNNPMSRDPSSAVHDERCENCYGTGEIYIEDYGDEDVDENSNEGIGNT